MDSRFLLHSFSRLSLRLPPETIKEQNYVTKIVEYGGARAPLLHTANIFSDYNTNVTSVVKIRDGLCPINST
jgi:hypothetical protein